MSEGNRLRREANISAASKSGLLTYLADYHRRFEVPARQELSRKVECKALKRMLRRPSPAGRVAAWNGRRAVRRAS